MPAGDPASIFRPDTRPAWIEATQVVAFFIWIYILVGKVISNQPTHVVK